MEQLINNIINNTNYKLDCHGLQAKEAATKIAKHYFKRENLSFNNWIVREIPLIDKSGKYPVAIVLCVNNKKEEKEISLNLTINGDLFSVNPDELCQIDLNTIKEAINHPTAKY